MHTRFSIGLSLFPVLILILVNVCECQHQLKIRMFDNDRSRKGETGDLIPSIPKRIMRWEVGASAEIPQLAGQTARSRGDLMDLDPRGTGVRNVMPYHRPAPPPYNPIQNPVPRAFGPDIKQAIADCCKTQSYPKNEETIP